MGKKGKGKGNQPQDTPELEALKPESLAPPDDLIDPDIDVELVEPPSVAQRYYEEKRFASDAKGKVGEDMYVLQHSNGLCVIGLASGHQILTQDKSVVSISWNLASEGKVPSGKKKLGARWCGRDAEICVLECSDGTRYIIHANIRGSLIEMNPQLTVDPGLVARDPDEKGYIAILVPKQGEKDEVTKRLMTASAYDTHLKARAKGETPAQLDTLNREKKRKIGDAAETESKNDATNVVEVSPDAVKIDELASTTMSVSDDNRIATSSGTSAAGSPTPGDKRPANDLL